MTVNELVERLSIGKHAVILEDRNDSYEDVQRRIQDGFVHIKFTKTRGTGTELGINVDHSRTDLTYANFEKKVGKLNVEGTTTLNYTPVRCVIDVDLSTKLGEGHLEVIDASELVVTKN